jgi:hypothetical protein
MRKIAVLVSVVSILLCSCRKEPLAGNCADLKAGLTANDLEKVRASITRMIGELPSSDYNEANITALSERISSSCAVTATSTCFDCIYTLPSQTEVIITINSSGVTKVIDLSYTSENKIVFRNMHE